MAVTINGTTGIAGVDGSAGTPSVQGADSNTGMFFPAADTIAFAEGGTEVVRIDSSGEVTRFNTNPGGMTIKRTDGVNSNGWLNFVGSDDVVDGSVRMATDAANALTFLTAATERARFDSSGNLLVGKTSAAGSVVGVQLQPNGQVFSTLSGSTNSSTTLEAYSTGAGAYRFYVGMGGTVFATSTTISAISDQRLKENVQDLDVGLDAVMALKPRMFDWKEGKGKNIKGDRGWIAQEFEQVFPDMIDEWRDEAPKGEEPYKSVRADLIPVLVKAIQEQQALITSLTARIAALEGAAQ